MDVDKGQGADQAASKQADDWRMSPIFGALTAIICVSSIVIAPMAAIAHHASQPPIPSQQDGE
jgi:hypothetical protein